MNSRPNVFSSILQPSPGAKEKNSMGLQMEMHLRSAPDSTQFTVLLNNMRLMCIFDWLMAMQEFISKELPDPFLKNTGSKCFFFLFSVFMMKFFVIEVILHFQIRELLLLCKFRKPFKHL